MDQESVLAVVLRNFNNLGQVKAALLTGVVTDVMFYRVDLKRVLKPEIIKTIMAECPDGVSAQVFINHGQMMADSLGRPVRLTHQYGSGRQEEAEFNSYEFTPPAA